jgi:hypothetical protein
MQCGLRRDVLGSKHFLPISEEVFKSVRDARARSIRAVEIEEKLDMVLQNYIEYEHELLQMVRVPRYHSRYQSSVS